MNRSLLSLVLVCTGLLALAGTSFAQSATARTAPPSRPAAAAPASLPDWDHLSPAQRDAILAVVRERWNGNPGQRARMLQHAERWRQMSPEQRRQAMHGQRRWEQMSPQARERALATYRQSHGQGQPRNGGGLPTDQRREVQDDLRALQQEDRRGLRREYKAMTPEQREQARRQWESMTPEQRRQWMRDRRRGGQGGQ